MTNDVEKLTALIITISKDLSPEGKLALSELIGWFTDNLDHLKSTLRSEPEHNHEDDVRDQEEGRAYEARQAEDKMISHYQDRTA